MVKLLSSVEDPNKIGEHEVRAMPKYSVAPYSPVILMYSGTGINKSVGLCQARTMKRGTMDLGHCRKNYGL